MELWVPGTPVAAERPRLARGRRAYTPGRTLEAEWAIAQLVSDGWSKDVPITVHVDLSNQGTRIRVSEATDREKAMRGDVDNYAKTVMDGLQKGGAFHNDGQVVSLAIDKWPAWVDPRDVTVS
jgi:Holliday junction resolvase RusA-like endonuclease